MSKSRKELKQWIEEQTFPTICALAVCYVCTNPDEYNRACMRNNVHQGFKCMHLLTNNNRLPTKKFIYKNSWELNNQFTDCTINYAITRVDRNNLRDSIHPLDFKYLCMRYFDWLSEKLTEVKIITLNDVEIKLKELGL